MTEVKKLATTERKRTYIYADERTLAFTDVVAVGVSESGNHRLETGDGMKHIVLAGFIAITLNVETWTF